MIVDFTNKKLLTESWLKQFGAWNKLLLKYMYGNDVNMVADLGAHKMLGKMFEEGEEGVDNELKFVVRGEHRDVKAYADALFAEKTYLDTYMHFGEDHPQTQKARTTLRQAVQQFQGTTGITWPFKDED